MHARRWATPIALVAVAAAGAAERSAAAGPEIEADGTINVGYNQISQSTFQADPMAEPDDIPDDSSSRLFTEIRPGITIQTGSARLFWRFNYQPSVNLSIEGSPAYSNQLNVAAATLPSKYTTLTLSALAAQGGTSFLLSQRPAETGGPELRAPGNPNIVSASLAESLSWEAGKLLRLQQGLTGTVSAPQDDLGESNRSLNATLALERLFRRFTAGLEVRAGVSRLQPLLTELPPYTSITNAVLLRFNHDFTWRWSGGATAGVEQVYIDNGSEPVAILPTGSITALYTYGNTSAALDLSHGALTNIQVGTVSVTDKITARGILTLDARKLRTISFSAGVLHNEPIGESAALVAAGTGNAISGDAGFSTMFTTNILGTARYSIAYQFDQGAGLDPVLAHIFLVGVTARYGNVSPATQVPVRGRRVDGTDGKGLPVGGNPVEGAELGGFGGPGPASGAPAGGAGTGGAGGTSTGGGTAPNP